MRWVLGINYKPPEDEVGTETGRTCSPRHGGIMNFNKTTASKIEAWQKSCSQWNNCIDLVKRSSTASSILASLSSRILTSDLLGVFSHGRLCLGSPSYVFCIPRVTSAARQTLGAPHPLARPHLLFSSSGTVSFRRHFRGSVTGNYNCQWSFHLKSVIIKQRFKNSRALFIVPSATANGERIHVNRFYVPAFSPLCHAEGERMHEPQWKYCTYPQC